MRFSAGLAVWIGTALAAASTLGLGFYISSAGQRDLLASSSGPHKPFVSAPPTSSAALRELQPVTFHLKSDPRGALQFGLIADEVDQACPDLVIRDSNGAIQGVRYDELAPMLLNEMQKQQATIKLQAEKLEELGRQVTELNQLRQELRGALHEIRSNRIIIAQR
jgi:hypothetical protein